jgi:hypothetical protein
MDVQLLPVCPDPYKHIVQAIFHGRQIGDEFQSVLGQGFNVFIIEQGKSGIVI